MKDHPIPQDVTGYKFHIVGNMTLKQFGLIVFGVIVAFIIYQLKLPPLVAWPFIVLFAGGGLLAAFVPFEERPLDHWLLTFIKTLYKPTLFYWKRQPHIPAVFEYVASTNQSTPPPTDLAPAKRARIHDYLNSLHTSDTAEVDENSQQIAQILADFNSSSVPAANLPAPAHQPSMTVRVRALAPDPDQPPIATLPPQPPATEIFTAPPAPVVVSTPSTPVIPTPVVLPPIMAPIPTRTISQAADSIQVPAQTQVTMEHQHNNTNQTSSDSSVATPSTPTAPTPDLTETPIGVIPDPTPVTQQNTVSSVTAGTATVSEAAQQPGNLPFPSPPTQPNLVVGMVVNSNQELLPGAIVEVATASGQVVRVVRTNALGQFFVTTPLPNGSYVLQAEQEGLHFTPQQLEITNSPVAPILFRATG